MIPKAVTLLLVAATAVSGRITQGSRSYPHQMVLMPATTGCPSALEPAPLICKFMLPELHYKPQLIAPSTYIPPLVIEKCDNPQMDIEIPAPIKKPIVIPAPPVLPPITIPKFPVPVMVEKPLPPTAPLVEPCEPTFVSEITNNIPLVPEAPITTPVLPEIVAQPEPFFDPFVPEMPHQPMIVPQSPVLSEFVMPDFPVIIETPAAEPCPEDQPSPIAPMPLPFIKPAFIPEALVSRIPATPELPPLEMPTLPQFVVPEEPYQPVAVPQPSELPAVEIQELPVRVEVTKVEPCPEDQPIPIAHMPEEESIFVPEIPMPPALPPFELPALSEVKVKPEVPEASYQPIEVPQPPEAAFAMPELPVRVETYMPEPCLEGQMIPVAPMPNYFPPPVPMPLPVEEFYKPAFIPKIPTTPKLPAFEIPTLTEIAVKPELPVASYLPASQFPTLSEFPIRVNPVMNYPFPENQLPILSIPDYIQPMPVPELPKIPFAYTPILPQMSQPDPCIFDTALPVPELPKPPKSTLMPIFVDPCEPSSKQVKIADLPPYFVRYPSYIPAVHGDYYNHLPRMGVHLPHV